MSMAHAWRRLLPVMVALGLASCSDRMPGRPQVGDPLPPPIGNAPVDSTTLEANRALWAASRIDDYRFRFRWECFCGPEYVRVVEITVTNGAIVSVVDAETRRPLTAQAAARYRTIDGLFEFVRESIDYPAASIHAAFDPVLGYPAAAYVDYVAAMADDELGFRIYALIPFPQR